MLFKRYGGNAQIILKMELEEGYEILEKAFEKECEEKLYFRWAVGYQKLISFEEFRRRIGVGDSSKNDTRSKEEILDMVREILEGAEVDGDI